jgi:hypothetical protein
VKNDEEQEKNDDALNEANSGSDYMSEDELEGVVAEQKDSS